VERRQPTAAEHIAGSLPLTEPELRQALAEAEAAGTLRCAVCGLRLSLEEVRLIRRPVGMRWATLTVHPACLQRPAAVQPPSPPAIPPAAETEAGRASIGCLEVSPHLPVLVLDVGAAADVWQALEQLGLGEAVPCTEEHGQLGSTVRALRVLFPDLVVFDGRLLELSVGWEGPSVVRYSLLGPGGEWQARGPAEASHLPERAELANWFVALWYTEETPQPLAALLLPPGTARRLHALR